MYPRPDECFVPLVLVGRSDQAKRGVICQGSVLYIVCVRRLSAAVAWGSWAIHSSHEIVAPHVLGKQQQ